MGGQGQGKGGVEVWGGWGKVRGGGGRARAGAGLQGCAQAKGEVAVRGGCWNRVQGKEGSPASKG